MGLGMDMLSLVSTTAGIRDAQEQLVNDLENRLPALGRHWVTFRPRGAELDIVGKGSDRLYFGTRMLRDMQKFWNAFGIFDPDRKSQEIAVEINFSLGNRRTAGFFAEDAKGGIFLMHNGGIGGGKKGVGPANFLAWLKPEPIAVETEDGKVKHGILIGKLGARNLADRIESFVQSVRSFKDAVERGELETSEFQRQANRWRQYLKEFSGRKSGVLNVDLDYVSYHGDVVDALKPWVESRVPSGVTITNSPLIDLLAHKAGRLTAIYEVKTSTNRQALYAGIGQLVVHGARPAGVHRHLVVPYGESIASDIETALRQLDIAMIRFRINRDDSVTIVG